MKQKVNITLVTFITIVSLSGCTSTGTVTPTQNSKLENVSPTNNNKKAGYMQNSLDNWLKDEWTPTLQKDPIIQEKYMKEENNTTKEEIKYTEKDEKGFTLQEYVDKAVAYQKAKPSDENSSHVKQMDSLPVVGK